MGERDPLTNERGPGGPAGAPGPPAGAPPYGSSGREPSGFGSRGLVSPGQGSSGYHGLAGSGDSANLADILERVLDKGVVIAGDIRINLLDIELLTIKLRLVVASVDKAKEMGIDWWERDPALSSRARGRELDGGDGGNTGGEDRP